MRNVRNYTSFIDVITQTSTVTADIDPISITDNPELQRFME